MLGFLIRGAGDQFAFPRIGRHLAWFASFPDEDDKAVIKDWFHFASSSEMVFRFRVPAAGRD
jgi:hypothetical protein